MSNIQVDLNRCTGCKQCEKVCPNDCFTVENGVVQVVHQNCLGCGHCLAACPVSVITVQGLDLSFDFQTFTELAGVTLPQEGDLAQLVRLMRSRRSVRNYTAQPVALPILEDLVKIGTTAPSGTNSQLWTFTILEHRVDVVAFGDGVARFFKRLNKKAAKPVLRGLARVFAGDSLGRYYRRHYKTIQRGLDDWFKKGEDHLFHGAQAVILVGGRREASCPAEDALLATGQILLAAQQMGLGTCLIGFVVEALKHDPALREMIDLDTDEDIYAVIGLGYPDEQYRQPAPRKRIQTRIVKLG